MRNNQSMQDFRRHDQCTLTLLKGIVGIAEPLKKYCQKFFFVNLIVFFFMYKL